MKSRRVRSRITSRNIAPIKEEFCSKPGDKISGTYFFGGAGMNGHFISPMIMSLKEAGIESAIYTDQDKWVAGISEDAAISTILWRDYDPGFQMLLRIPEKESEQFNLIGYSYGSVITAQFAAKYAKEGTDIDHLVLIGSPISETFVKTLNAMPHIKKVIIKNLVEHGDPIYAGINMLELFSKLTILAGQKLLSEGHFYYVDPTIVGDKRRKELAKELYDLGLR